MPLVLGEGADIGPSPDAGDFQELAQRGDENLRVVDRHPVVKGEDEIGLALGAQRRKSVVRRRDRIADLRQRFIDAAIIGRIAAIARKRPDRVIRPLRRMARDEQNAGRWVLGGNDQELWD